MAVTVDPVGQAGLDAAVALVVPAAPVALVGVVAERVPVAARELVVLAVLPRVGLVVPRAVRVLATANVASGSLVKAGIDLLVLLVMGNGVSGNLVKLGIVLIVLLAMANVVSGSLVREVSVALSAMANVVRVLATVSAARAREADTEIGPRLAATDSVRSVPS